VTAEATKPDKFYIVLIANKFLPEVVDFLDGREVDYRVFESEMENLTELNIVADKRYVDVINTKLLKITGQYDVLDILKPFIIREED
jgi:hypothetical protein